MTEVADWGFPEITDDNGDRQSGTPIGHDVFLAAEVAINAVVHSPANPTITPADTIDEVVEARGSFTTLDERIDSLAAGGGAGDVTTAELANSLYGNWAGNDDFQVWAAGDALAPTLYTLVGGTIARQSAIRKVGLNAPALTYVSTPCTLTQTILDAIGASGFAADIYRGVSFGFGIWIYCATANIAGLKLNDGIADSALAEDVNGNTRHQGTSAWVWFSGVHSLAGTASKLDAKMDMIGAGVAYFSGLTVFPSDIAPARHVPCPTVYGSLTHRYPGTLPAGQTTASAHLLIDKWTPQRCGIIKDVRLDVDDSPTTTNLIVDVQTHDGAGNADTDWRSVYSAVGNCPKILPAALAGSAIPQGTYANRCLQGSFDALTPVSGKVRSVIRQTDGVDPGGDLWVRIGIMQYARPQERFLAYNK